MTREEYEKYQKNVESFFEETGLTNLSPVSDFDGNRKEGFNIGPCPCCGTPLGGTYVDCDGYAPKTREIKEYTVCQDCVWYAEHGQLDDETMMSISDE